MTISRRDVLLTAPLAGAVPLLVACGAGSSDPTPVTGDSTSGGSPSSGSGSSSVKSLGAASDIPVGGGVIYQDQAVVVTQPTSGDYEGFSAVCPHQGCIVSTVSNGKIGCGCHGSTFSAADGSLVTGPATRGLDKVSVSVVDGQITLG